MPFASGGSPFDRFPFAPPPSQPTGGLRRRPHTLSVVAPAVATGTNDVEGVPTWAGTPVEVLGQVAPLSSDAAFREFGLEIRRAFRVLVNLADADYFPVGAKVECASRSEFYRVVALPERYDANPNIAYAKLLVEATTPTGDPF